MHINRVIPVLLIQNGKLVKTVKYKNANYIGDPVNAVKIFNDKMVDEIVLLDISATKEKREPDYLKVEEICSEAFMPFAYGGGITNIDQVKRLFNIGIEKVVLNSVLRENLMLIKEISSIYGVQSVIASVDIKKTLFSNKYVAFSHNGTKKVKRAVLDHLEELENAGAGEILLNFIDRDGTYSGYDDEAISVFSNHLDIPLIACGGASSLTDFKRALNSGASAVAAGSLFVYRSRSKGILINYPSQAELKKEVFNSQ